MFVFFYFLFKSSESNRTVEPKRNSNRPDKCWQKNDPSRSPQSFRQTHCWQIPGHWFWSLPRDMRVWSMFCSSTGNVINDSLNWTTKLPGSLEIEMTTPKINEQWCTITEFPDLAWPKSAMLKFASGLSAYWPGISTSQMRSHDGLKSHSASASLTTLEYKLSPS